MPKEELETNTESSQDAEESGSSSLKTRILKSELVRIGAAVFFGLALLIFLIPLFFNNSGLKFQIEQKISQIYGANFTIYGDVKVSFLPSPTISAENVVLQNYKTRNPDDEKSEKIYNLSAKLVKVRFPIFKFSSNSLIKKITFYDAVLESYYDSNQPAIRENKFVTTVAEITKNAEPQTSKSNSGISASIFSISNMGSEKIQKIIPPSIIIKNGTAIFYNKLTTKKEISAINSFAEIDKEKIKISGTFNSDNIANNLKFIAKFHSTSNKPDSLLEISSSIAKINIYGNFSAENKGLFLSDFKGKIEAEIFELRSFYKNYISADDSIFQKIKPSSKSIKISADVINDSGEVAVGNLLINSLLIDGKGSIDLNFTNKIPLIDVVLDLDSLDLDNIWSGDSAITEEESNVAETKKPVEENNAKIASAPTLTESSKDKSPTEEIASSKNDTSTTQESPTSQDQPNAESQTSEIKTAEPPKIEPIDFDFTNKIKDFDLTAEIKIKNVKYLEGEIKDVDIYLTVSERGEILVMPIIFRIPGGGTVRINGALDNSQTLPKFVGKFDSRGNALNEILKWLGAESQNLKFDNLKNYNVYSDVLLLPNSMTFDNFYLNLNNGQSEFLGDITIDGRAKVVNITNQFQISNFNMDDYFLTSGQNVYLSPGSLLRKLLWLNNISSNSSFDLTFDKLTYKGEDFDNQSLKLRLKRGYIEITDLNLNSEKTKLNLNLAIDISDKNPTFDVKITSDNFHYDTANNSEKSEIKKRDFTDQFYALPSLDEFSGRVNFDFKNLKLDDKEINNAKLSGILKSGVINILQLTCDIYGGNLKFKGDIGIKANKNISGNLSLSNVLLQPLFFDLFEIKNIGGIANITSSITSSNNKKENLAKSLDGEIKFSAVAPSVTGYGLNNLVKKMFAPVTYASELKTPQKVLFDPEATTNFKQANGSIKLHQDGEGSLRINVGGTALNGILSGKIDPANNGIDALFNVVFLSGNSKKQIPINIATNIKGQLNNISQSTNLDQVNQFLGIKITPNNEISSQEQLPVANDNMVTSNSEENSVINDNPIAKDK